MSNSAWDQSYYSHDQSNMSIKRTVTGVVFLPYAVLLLLVDIPMVYLQIMACIESEETVGSLQASAPLTIVLPPVLACPHLLPFATACYHVSLPVTSTWT